MSSSTGESPIKKLFPWFRLFDKIYPNPFRERKELMGLDVYLYKVRVEICAACDLCKEKGLTEAAEILEQHQRKEVFTARITHNLGIMAEQANLYQVLWCPEELAIIKASQLIPYLENGLAVLQADPNKFYRYDPPNNWGSYEGLVRFVSKYLDACKEHPDAVVEASR
jgi:hypothetical protein